MLAQGGVVLHVVQRGERVDTVPQRRMSGDVLDSLATEPDFCRLLPQISGCNRLLYALASTGLLHIILNVQRPRGMASTVAKATR
jgi:hypothetical protein